MQRLRNVNLLFVLKTGVGSATAILLATKLGLVYSASAGIITLLTLQNTKKETIIIAFKRVIAFFIATTIAYVLFTTMGYTGVAFGGFVLVFVAICTILKLTDGISMNAVLMTHFLVEKRMDASLLVNEILLLVIGMGIGIILNLMMPRNKALLVRWQKELDDKIIANLKEIAKVLKTRQEYSLEQLENISFISTNKLLEELLGKAYEDANNRLLSDTKYLVSYLEMRKMQIKVLEDIIDSIKETHIVLPQTYVIAEYIEQIAEQYSEFNDVTHLIQKSQELDEFFKKEELPRTREEFENRAILFKILRDLEYFLQLKNNFALLYYKLSF